MSKRVSVVRQPPADTRPKNKLLASLPRAEFQRIRPHLRTRPIAVRHVFQSAHQPVRDVYFLNGGVASVTAVMQNGSMVEIATVGDEGVVGINALFGDGTIVGETMMQVPDTSGEVMSVERFRAELDRKGAFFESVQRYSQAFLSLMMQSAACLALHPVHARCCRWLLMTHDRVRHDQFHLSHEFLAMMLGSTRPTVTAVAGALQKQGLIKYVHGRITIVDRQRLEASSCECYPTIRKVFDRLDL